MTAFRTSPPGTPTPAEPVAAAIDHWVDAASDDVAAALAAVVARVAQFVGVGVALVVDGVEVEPDPEVAAVDIPHHVLESSGPWLPGFVRESLLSRAGRRRGGVHHTSPEMAAVIVDFVAGFRSFDESTIVADPAVGGGAFLLAACDRLPGTRAARVARVEGCDVDPLAVGVTEAALRLWAGGASPQPGAIAIADGLSGRPFPRTPDIVLGNPPFLSQLRDDTTRDEERRADLRARWPELGGYVDDAAAFLLASVDQVADGGVVALVQPSSFLSVRDAAPVRERLWRDAPPIGVWIDGARQFDAAVDTVAVVVRKGVEPGAIRRISGVPAAHRQTRAPDSPTNWAALLLDDDVPAIQLEDLRRHGTVGDVAEVTAGFRDHFYGLRGAVADDPEGGLRLITSGLIDPLESRWGRANCRFDRRQWACPIVDPEAVAPGIAGWIGDRRRPKLLVASQTRVIEVVVDRDGTMIPCTPVVSVEPRQGAPSLAHLAAALASPVASALLLAVTAGSALSRDAMRVSAATISSLPLPEQSAEWDAAAAAVHALGAVVDRSELIEVARLATLAYGVEDPDDLLNWWQPRLPGR